MSILNEFPEEDKWVESYEITSCTYYSIKYIDWLETKVEELGKQNENLKKTLAAERLRAEKTRQREVRRFKYEQDYLPYEERYE